MQAVLLLSKLSLETVGEPLDMEQLFDAVNVILSLQVWVLELTWNNECFCILKIRIFGKCRIWSIFMAVDK